MNYGYRSIADLEATWSKMDDPRAAEMGKALAAFVVPGSHRWDIFRIQE